MKQTFFWEHSKRFNDSTNYYKKTFLQRVQKISIDAGFTCPNRDNTKGNGGCIFCDNKTFNPFYCKPEKSITRQLNEGIAFFSKKYKTQKYLAYFQAYSNTYADLSKLKSLYEEALQVKGVIGLVIATRPDCISIDLLLYLEQLAKQFYISIEYGLESCYDTTLTTINRCHTFEDSVNAIKLTLNRNIMVGAHLILGLPGETKEMILNEAGMISELGIDMIKLHQLQIIKNTPIEKLFLKHPELFIHFTPESYTDHVVDFIERLSPAIIIERFVSESPLGMIISPNWGGLKNFELVHRIEQKLKDRDTWQGKLFSKKN